jgi:toxin ParE1/3/4
MAYRVTVAPRAQKEIEHAIDYYSLYSTSAPGDFIKALQQAYQNLETNPYFRIYYKNIRGLRIKRFPYVLFFTVNEQNQHVRILSCFHSKRNPGKRPEL